MNFSKIIPKWRHFTRVGPSHWMTFLGRWMTRAKRETVPVSFQKSGRLVEIPKRDFYESYFFFTEEKQGIKEIEQLFKGVPDHPVFFDLGGFRGAISMAVWSRFPGAAIDIFEPLKSNYDKIQKIVHLNGAAGDISVHRTFVGQDLESTPYFERGDGMAIIGVGGDATDSVPSISLDRFCDQKGVFPNIVKIDVEGAEVDVLMGAKRMLAKSHPRIFLEVHPQILSERGTSVDECLKLLSDEGYSFTKVGELQDACHIWCEPKSGIGGA